MILDLTPFGFTPTEGAAFQALCKSGPLSGYAVAKSLSIARANAYQALEGLVAKGAADRSGENPRVFRAVSPTALLALIGQAQAARLEHLDEQLAALRRTGAPATREFRGGRELDQLLLRTTTRVEQDVTFVGASALVKMFVPIWRKRIVDGRSTSVWVVGEAPPDFPAETGTVAEQVATNLFGAPPVLVLAGEVSIIGTDHEGHLAGLWSTNPVLLGTARCAAALLTRSSPS